MTSNPAKSVKKSQPIGGTNRQPHVSPKQLATDLDFGCTPQTHLPFGCRADRVTWKPKMSLNFLEKIHPSFCIWSFTNGTSNTAYPSGLCAIPPFESCRFKSLYTPSAQQVSTDCPKMWLFQQIKEDKQTKNLSHVLNKNIWLYRYFKYNQWAMGHLSTSVQPFCAYILCLSLYPTSVIYTRVSSLYLHVPRPLFPLPCTSPLAAHIPEQAQMLHQHNHAWHKQYHESLELKLLSQ